VELVFKETSLVTCKEVSFDHFIVMGVVSFIKFATNKPPGKKSTFINLQIKTQLFNDTKLQNACSLDPAVQLFSNQGQNSWANW
jgi:hypothetical protein